MTKFFSLRPKIRPDILRVSFSAALRYMILLLMVETSAVLIIHSDSVFRTLLVLVMLCVLVMINASVAHERERYNWIIRLIGDSIFALMVTQLLFQREVGIMQALQDSHFIIIWLLLVLMLWVIVSRVSAINHLPTLSGTAYKMDRIAVAFYGIIGLGLVAFCSGMIMLTCDFLSPQQTAIAWLQSRNIAEHGEAVSKDELETFLNHNGEAGHRLMYDDDGSISRLVLFVLNYDFSKNLDRKLQEQVSHPMARHREMNCYL